MSNLGTKTFILNQIKGLITTYIARGNEHVLKTFRGVCRRYLNEGIITLDDIMQILNEIESKPQIYLLHYPERKERLQYLKKMLHEMLRN